MAINISEGFKFYLHFAKPLVLRLPDPNGKCGYFSDKCLLINVADRIVAAAWVQKLRDESVGSEKLRTDYLKLLLFVLQRSRLIGPFNENPNNYEKLEEFPPYYKVYFSEYINYSSNYFFCCSFTMWQKN